MKLKKSLNSSFRLIKKRATPTKKKEEQDSFESIVRKVTNEPSIPSCIDVVDITNGGSTAPMDSIPSTLSAYPRDSLESMIEVDLDRSSERDLAKVERRKSHAMMVRRRSSEMFYDRDRAGSLKIKQQVMEELQRSEAQIESMADDPNMPREWTGKPKALNIVCGQNEANKDTTYWYRLAVKTSNKDTPPNEIVRRGAFMLMSSLTCGAGLIWASLYYFILNEPRAALFPTIYSVLMTLCFIFLTTEGQYHNIVFIQLLLILVLPISMQLSVGGIVKGGAVMIWSFLCPLGAALFCNHSIARRWFIVYFLSVVCTLCNEFLVVARAGGPIFFPNDVAILGGKEIGLFMMNIGGAMTITFCGALLFSIKLDEEFNRSEELLQNILPKSISTRLKKGETHIVENIDSVTIMFADLVGFTKASSEFHPNFLIGMFLRDIFSAWDQLSQRRSIEKIKTIGDAYMCVGGFDDTDDSCECGSMRKQRVIAYEMVMLGLEMKHALDAVNAKHGTEFQVRIGIHTGPCIAGVIGVKRFAFDVWGDAVNIASRMESHGVPGQIHMSYDTYEKVKHLSYLNFRCRGENYVKGKGIMKTYLVDLCEEQRRTSLSRLTYESCAKTGNYIHEHDLDDQQSIYSSRMNGS